MLHDARFISFVATQDAKKAREFYEKTLGLKFVSGDEFALVFELGGRMLRVQKVEQVNPRSYTVLGWSVSDIKKEITELDNRGVRFARYEGLAQDNLGIWSAPSGAKVAWFNDPDGNILSLTQF